jgi:heme exporter protein D
MVATFAGAMAVWLATGLSLLALAVLVVGLVYAIVRGNAQKSRRGPR